MNKKYDKKNMRSLSALSILLTLLFLTGCGNTDAAYSESTTENRSINSTFSDLTGEQEDLITQYKQVKRRSDEIETEFQEGLMDQVTMNQAEEEDFANWDTLLNRIWMYLKSTLSEDEFQNLKKEQLIWIDEKEAAVRDAIEEAGGGSMQTQLENGTAASWTKKRVDYLMNEYVNP